MKLIQSVTLMLVPALAVAARAQEIVKPPVAAPRADESKSPPEHFDKESGDAHVPSVTLPPLDPSAAAARRERAKDSSAPVRRTLEYPIFDVDETGTLWVRGSTYKASFGLAGATYVPFLGKDAARNWPISMRIASITANGAPVGFDAEVPAARDASTIAFERGSVVEQYLIGREGMEQRFVFDTLPSRGEIVVTIALETELEARVVDEGLRFENDLGAATYGRALALDASGRTSPMEERLEQGRIQLVVPAEFVASAELPLVIDPYVSTMPISVAVEEDFNADVAVVTLSDAMLVVFETTFSATDHDVHAYKYVDELFNSMHTIDVSGTDWHNPRVAGNELNERFLCVAEVGAAGSRTIRGRIVHADSFTTGSVLDISGTDFGEKHDPDVGGDPRLFGSTFFCVVWERDFSPTDTDIHARLVTGAGTLVGGGSFNIDNSGGTLDSKPSISKTDGVPPTATQNWIVAWVRASTPTDDDVYGARVRWDGTITSSTFAIASTAANERLPTVSEPLDPVAGQPRKWLAAYTMGSSLRFRSFDDTSVVSTLDLAAGSVQSFSAPDLSIDGRLWQVAFTQRNNTVPFADTDVRAASLNDVGGVLAFSETMTPIADSVSENELRPRIASTMAGPDPFRSYIAYDKTDPSGDIDVYVGKYDSPINAGGYPYCFGTAAACPCGNAGGPVAGCASSVSPNGATLVQTGQWAISHDTAVLTASGMPATASALYFQANGLILDGAPFGDGLRCANGGVVRLATKASVGGTSHFPGAGDPDLHVKGNVPSAGGWRYYQAWYRNIATFCTASTFNLTNGVALLWAP